MQSLEQTQAIFKISPTEKSQPGQSSICRLGGSMLVNTGRTDRYAVAVGRINTVMMRMILLKITSNLFVFACFDTTRAAYSVALLTVAGADRKCVCTHEIAARHLNKLLRMGIIAYWKSAHKENAQGDDQGLCEAFSE